MQLEFIFQNPVVIVVVLFGMSCTMGLSVIIPVVANVMLAVFGGWAGDIAESVAKKKTRDSAFPDERDDFPKQVIGYAPGTEPGPAPAAAPLQVEADEVPTGLLVRLAVAVTVVAAVLVLGGVKLFEHQVAQELGEKGYEKVEVIPHVSAK
jgi:hypothetical protein